jgi:hypothetical protein
VPLCCACGVLVVCGVCCAMLIRCNVDVDVDVDVDSNVLADHF